jgi:Mrp family chromosome partitioning ATPase
MAQMTGEFPRVIARPVWLTARARNAMHRPVFIGAVGVGTFVAALAALFLAPQQAKHVGQLTTLSSTTRPDTAPFAAALKQARTRLTAADSSLAFARSHVLTAPAPVVDTLSPIIRARRDTLSNVLNDLDALLTRVETVPVAASYRALAESPQLSSTPRVKALLDSLADVERDREAFGTSGGADPTYLALSSRATEIGRAIESIGQERRDALREQIAKLNVPAPRQAVAASPVADTVAWLAERDSAQSMVGQATNLLADASGKAKEYDRAVTRANEEAKLDAPEVALLAAALVFGIALGFGSAFLGEMRHPRVSDEHELERVTGTRVLATVRPRPRQRERRRRMADRDAPPYFDPEADAYQLTYLHVARAGASRVMLTIAGADTGIAAIVGTNVAAIAADEARSTIIIDTDSRTSPVAAALRIHAEPGVADVLERRIDWSEVTSQAKVGRDRSISVVPAGLSAASGDVARVTELFRREAARMARHYEAIVIVTTIEQAAAGLPGALPIPDTILCARVGHTRIADLQAWLEAVRTAGGNPLGVVLWDAPPPALATPARIASSPRPLRTAEMKAITTGS